MKKIEKMIHQIIRFRGNIEAFLVSIEEFSSFTRKVTKHAITTAMSVPSQLAEHLHLLTSHLAAPSMDINYQ